MNTKPKKITAAYSKALKYAHKPESRVRLVFIGDTGSGIKGCYYVSGRYAMNIINIVYAREEAGLFNTSLISLSSQDGRFLMIFIV